MSLLNRANSNILLRYNQCVKCSSILTNLYKPTILYTQSVRHAGKQPNRNDKKNMKQKASVKVKKLKQQQNSDILDDDRAELLNKLQFDSIEDKMIYYIDALKSTYNNIRVGRANPNVLDNITIEYNNQRKRLNDITQINVKSSNTMSIQLFDSNHSKHIERGIRQFNDDLNPQYDSQTNQITVVFPKLTRDMRDTQIKLAQKKADETKLHIRNVRQEALQRIKSIKDATDDDKDFIKSELQLLTDEMLAEIDELFKLKSKELNE